MQHFNASEDHSAELLNNMHAWLTEGNNGPFDGMKQKITGEKAAQDLRFHDKKGACRTRLLSAVGCFVLRSAVGFTSLLHSRSTNLALILQD